MNNWWWVAIATVVCAIVLFVVVAIKEKDIFSIFCETWIDCVATILAVVCVFSIMVGIIGTLTAKHNYNKYKESKRYVMRVVQSMEEIQYANFGITQKILNYNSWLEDAKARKETYGNWSFYKDYPLEEMTYIGTNEE